MVSQSNFNSERLLILVFLSLCFAGSALAQIRTVPTDSADSGLGGNNAITGSVFHPSGQKMDRRIRVRLFTMTKGDVTSMTDDDGNFSFRGLVSGRYTITIDNEKEYEPFSQQVEIIQFRGSPPQNYPMNIRLAVKGKTGGFKPGVVASEFANVPQRALDFFKKAQELAKAGDHKGAIEQLQLATSEYPKFMFAFNEMGVQYIRLNELEKADESLRMALKIKPDAFEPLMNRGMLLAFSKRFAEAEPLFRKAVKIRERSAVGHYFLGRALANLGRFDEAEKELVSAVTLGGDEMKEPHRVLAIIYSARGDKKHAVVELETYLRLAPTAADAEQLRQVIQKLKGSGTQTSTAALTTKPSQ